MRRSWLTWICSCALWYLTRGAQTLSAWLQVPDRDAEGQTFRAHLKSSVQGGWEGEIACRWQLGADVESAVGMRVHEPQPNPPVLETQVQFCRRQRAQIKDEALDMQLAILE